MQDNLIKQIKEKINTKEEISPFLFIWSNISNINLFINELSQRLSSELWSNKNFIFSFIDNNEKIKVKDIKEFLEKIFITPTYWSQIFIIENISRMTEESANSCLKIFEEPPIWNIILLSSPSESWVLETIISRCTIINMDKTIQDSKNEFYYGMIDDYVRWIDHDLASYVFKEKLEKQDYINILNTLIVYFKNNLVYLDLIENIIEDINWIQKNNVLPKYIVDKYIIRMKI